MVAGNGYECGELFLRGRTIFRNGNQQRLRPVGKTPFTFQLEKTTDVFLGQFWNFGMGNESPTQRNVYDTIAFPHTRLIQLLANLAANQFRIIRERIERKGSEKSLLGSY